MKPGDEGGRGGGGGFRCDATVSPSEGERQALTSLVEVTPHTKPSFSPRWGCSFRSHQVVVLINGSYSYTLMAAAAGSPLTWAANEPLIFHEVTEGCTSVTPAAKTQVNNKDLDIKM